MWIFYSLLPPCASVQGYNTVHWTRSLPTSSKCPCTAKKVKFPVDWRKGNMFTLMENLSNIIFYSHGIHSSEQLPYPLMTNQNAFTHKSTFCSHLGKRRQWMIPFHLGLHLKQQSTHHNDEECYTHWYVSRLHPKNVAMSLILNPHSLRKLSLSLSITTFSLPLCWFLVLWLLWRSALRSKVLLYQNE